jgi:phage terminase large subunit
LVAHRRAGKTVATINDVISRALYFNAYPDPRFAYIAPFYGQAKKIAWAYLKQYARTAIDKPRESDLSITIKHNRAEITLYGADNPDSFRGLYFDGVILDEYGNMRKSTWSEVLLPTLLDRRGWATFIGTPNGPNHFRDLYHEATKDPERWFVDLLPVSQTRLIPDAELEEMKKLMLPEEYEQEMECSFEASTKGAFYANEIAKAIEAGRVADYPADQDLLLHFVFDIGRTDDTALGAFQEHQGGANMVHSESENMRGPGYWIDRIYKICEFHGCKRGTVWLPHDARAKTWATQRSGYEQFIDAGIRPKIVPDLDVLDGINAARFVFQFVTINQPCCDKLELALKSYHRKYDEDKQAFTNDAVHDWSSHLADMFRYFGIVARFPHSRPLTIPPVTPEPTNPSIIKTYYPITLEQLWEDHDGRNRGNYIA